MLKTCLFNVILALAKGGRFCEKWDGLDGLGIVGHVRGAGERDLGRRRGVEYGITAVSEGCLIYINSESVSKPLGMQGGCMHVLCKGPVTTLPQS